MLKRDGEDFTIGRSKFLDRLPEDPGPTAKIYVKIRPDRLDVNVLAQLDTGSDWSVLEPEIAGAIGILNGTGELIKMDTRLGTFSGNLVRLPLTILSDEGDSLLVDATVFVSAEWPRGRNFLGYLGLLERIRFALDPQSYSFYFGPS